MSRIKLLIALTLLAAGSAHAQTYPAKPVRIVVPLAPGGSVDLVARLLAQRLTESLKQPFIVENRAGAAGNIGADHVARSAPNGYTLLFSSPTALASGISVYKKLPFDPRRDFAPVVLVTHQPHVLVVHPSVPAKNVKELIGLAKAHPEKLNHGTSGIGGMHHLRGEMFGMYAGVKITPVAYKGGGPATTALLSGEVDVVFDTVSTVVDHIRSGKMRALAVMSLKRVSMLPEVPTLHESGLSGFDFRSWHGLAAPAGTPREVLLKLNEEVNKALVNPELRNRLMDLGLEIAGGTIEDFQTFINKEIEKFAKIVKASGMPLQ